MFFGLGPFGALRAVFLIPPVAVVHRVVGRAAGLTARGAELTEIEVLVEEGAFAHHVVIH